MLRMETQRGPSLLLAWSAVLLCAVGSATPTPAPTSGPEVGGGGGGSAPAVHAHAHNQTRIGDGFNVDNDGGHTPIKTKEEGSGLIAPDPSSAVGSGRRSSSRRRRRMSSGGPGGWTTDQEEGGASAASSSSLCGYRVIEGGVGGPLCFRRTQLGFRCGRGNCRTVGSPGGLVAHVLTNGSVLLQWTHEGVMTTTTTGHHDPDVNETKIGDGRNASGDSTMGWTKGPRGRAGFELSCWWNGSYTQFECAGVHLGPGCRDYVLTELHENVPYRVCLRALGVGGTTTTPWGGPPPGDRRDCADFTVSSSGMQDIVIAMTTVGGAICVMLVIICLLVAYITENIMSPATQQQQHAYSYHTHSRH